MSLIQERFQLFQREKRCGFIPFIVAGDPDLRTTSDLISGLSRLDPVAIEVGVPFSDPSADGVVIQRAAQRSLRRGTSLAKIFKMLGRISEKHSPIVLFSYYNPILQLGIELFARMASNNGVSGVLVVDLPIEVAAPLHRHLRQRNIDLIFLAAPTTTDERLRRIVLGATGFIYAVSRTGVTGSANQLADESQGLVARIRAVSDLPIAVGFGISTQAQARRVHEYADAVVVGSRLVTEIETALTGRLAKRAMLKAVFRCARQFV